MNKRRLGEPRPRRRVKEKPKSKVVEAMMGRHDLKVGRQRFEGRYVVSTVIIVLLGIGMAYWWYQGRTEIHEISATDIVVNTYVYPVHNWQGVASDDSPKELRACFLFSEEDVQMDAPVLERIEDINPPQPPGWFKCFNPSYIRGEITQGAGKVYIAASNEVDGLDRVVAVLPGGRGFMWRQPHPKDSL